MNKSLYAVIILFASLICASCYTPINGLVIDAETQQPIEGAVVLVEWTKTHGFGHYWTESYKVVEVVSDKEGKVRIDGCYSPFVEKPDVTVYRKGYVAWNDKAIFQGPPRTDFKWGDYVFRLEHFKKGYSYIDHTDFITSSINASINIEAKKVIYNAFSWEDQMASKERDNKARNPRQ